MFYKYNKKTLLFKKCYKESLIFLFISLIIAIISGVIWGNYIMKTKIIELEGGIHIIKSEEKPFSKQSLINMINELEIIYPHIVLAQSIIETGHWSSLVFKENNNLFGMKMANRRIKTALGTQLNHAYYNSWQESVYDYAFYQCRYLSKLSSENDYYEALDATYSETGDSYSKSLKQIIQKENLKSLFK